MSSFLDPGVPQEDLQAQNMTDHGVKAAVCAGSNLGPYVTPSLICMAPLCSFMCLTAPLWDGYVPTEAIPDPHGQGPCAHCCIWSCGVSGLQQRWDFQGLLAPLWEGPGYCCSGWSFCLSMSLSQAQWDCVNAKYKQKKRNYKNSGVVVLADLKVSLGPALGP